MVKALIPSKPWTDLGCDPEEMVFLMATVLRGDHAAIEDWVGTVNDAVQVIEMLASRHRAGPYLSAKLRDTPAWKALPMATQERLLNSASSQVTATRDSLLHLREIGSILDAIDCEYLVLKGLELGARFTGGPDARGYRDIDILVPERFRSQVCDAMKDAGYHRHSRWLLGSSVSALFNHAADYRKAERLLDLHWCVSRAPGVRIMTSDLFARSTFFEIGDLSFRVLCIEDELTVLLVSAFADIQRGYLRLQSFVDIGSVMKHISVDHWEEFLRLQIRRGTERISRAVLGLVLSLLHHREEHVELRQLLGPLPSKSEALSLLLPSPGGRAAKHWALAHLPVGRLHYLCWWVFSMPFRVAASHHLFRRALPK
jgi:hypothetical protein